MNAQGEDVVAGIRTPLPIDELQGVMPAAYEQLTAIGDTLEAHYRDMQDVRVHDSGHAPLYAANS